MNEDHWYCSECHKNIVGEVYTYGVQVSSRQLYVEVETRCENCGNRVYKTEEYISLEE